MKTDILDRLIYCLFRSLNSNNSDTVNRATFEAIADCEGIKKGGLK